MQVRTVRRFVHFTGLRVMGSFPTDELEDSHRRFFR